MSDFTKSDLANMSDVIARGALAIGMTLAEACEMFEQRVITAALARTGGNTAAAARDLGVHRNTIYGKRRNCR